MGWYIVHSLSKKREVEKEYRANVRSKIDQFYQNINEVRITAQKCYSSEANSCERIALRYELKTQVEKTRINLKNLKEILNLPKAQAVVDDLEEKHQAFLQTVTYIEQYDSDSCEPIAPTNNINQKIFSKQLNVYTILEKIYNQYIITST